MPMELSGLLVSYFRWLPNFRHLILPRFARPILDCGRAPVDAFPAPIAFPELPVEKPHRVPDSWRSWVPTKMGEKKSEPYGFVAITRLKGLDDGLERVKVFSRGSGEPANLRMERARSFFSDLNNFWANRTCDSRILRPRRLRRAGYLAIRFSNSLAEVAPRIFISSGTHPRIAKS